MAGQFHARRVSRSTRQEDCDVLPAFEPDCPAQPCQFVDDFQQLMGDDFEPDPLFFVECWTVGKSAAARNFQQRRQEPAESERPSYAFHDVYSTSNPSFLQQDELQAEMPYAASAAAGARRCSSEWRRPSSEEPSARAQDENSQPGETFAEPPDSRLETIQPMTLKSACRLLGVTATSTRKEIRTAYRKMASQWHPDRLQFRTERVRRFATEQMAAINEAYHLLRSHFSQEPARFGPD